MTAPVPTAAKHYRQPNVDPGYTWVVPGNPRVDYYGRHSLISGCGCQEDVDYWDARYWKLGYPELERKQARAALVLSYTDWG